MYEGLPLVRTYGLPVPTIQKSRETKSRIQTNGGWLNAQGKESKFKVVIECP